VSTVCISEIGNSRAKIVALIQLIEAYSGDVLLIDDTSRIIKLVSDEVSIPVIPNYPIYCKPEAYWEKERDWLPERSRGYKHKLKKNRGRR
jgi:hypothetical protein